MDFIFLKHLNVSGCYKDIGPVADLELRGQQRQQDRPDADPALCLCMS